jgi:hypothetical protein
VIELSHEQVQALIGFMGNAKMFLRTVETAERSTAARRDSIIDDTEQWRALLLRKVAGPPALPTPGDAR